MVSAALFSFSSTMSSLASRSLSCTAINGSFGSTQRYNVKQPSFVGGERKVCSKQAGGLQRGKIVACYAEGTASTIATGVSDSFTLLKQEIPPAFWKEEMINSLLSSYDDQDAAEKEKRMQTLIAEIKAMFKSMGDGETSPSAYDTAWVARVPAVDGSNRPQFPQTLQWILQNQLSDGSWGEELCFLTYDRILATLACVITLTLWHTGDAQVKKGIVFIKKHAERMKGEAENHRLSGFEIVFISMLNEAKTLRLDLPYELPFFKLINEIRETKLKTIPLNVVHAIPTTILYSLEGLQEIIDWDKIMKLQSKNGSFLTSPASTAAMFMHTGDQKCLDFLTFVLNKFGDHVPCHYPLDLFERLWVVDTVERLGIDRYFQKEIKETLDYVYMYWDERGIGWARDNVVADIDDTTMGLRILRLHGYKVSSVAASMFEPEFAMCREAYTKASICTFILNYLYKAYAASRHDISLFSEAVTRWDLSLVDVMSQEMKICFLCLYDTINEIAGEGSKRQGHDVLPYIRNLMEVQVASHNRKSKWVQDKYVPSLDEYIENAKVSMGVGMIVLISILFMEELLSNNVLSKLGNGSRFLHLVSLTGRLTYDSKTYEENKIQGKICAIHCYIKDDPRISEEEALNQIHTLIQNVLLELNWEFITNNDVPKSCRKLVFNTARAMQLFFMEKDSSNLSHLEMQEHVKKCIFHPIL
uniref:Copalyl pyrophosphate synthase-like protein n=1 Tax=Taiwania cryptomerioides TaxID=50187 RepID=A0A1D5AJD6_TAICR|nr:copalyl pyrophosphate synthase-like protein [Taiwania cryptomerioides]